MGTVPSIPSLNAIITIALFYLGIGVVVCLVHPKIIRDHIANLQDMDLGLAGFFLKPVMALLAFLPPCVFWPIAWFNTARREKKERETLERLRAFHQLTSAMRAPVTYAGGDGSSFERAVILQGATLLSGPRAEHDFLARHYPGYEFLRQSLEERNGHTYDVLEFTTAEGESKAIYFDISANFSVTNVTKLQPS